MAEQVMTITRAAELMKANKQLLLMDVREDYEYEQGHIAQAVSCPLSILQSIPDPLSKAKLESMFNNPIDFADHQEQIILCYCQHGIRSLHAVGILQGAGFANVFSLEGGLEAWQKSQAMFSL